MAAQLEPTLLLVCGGHVQSGSVSRFPFLFPFLWCNNPNKRHPHNRNHSNPTHEGRPINQHQQGGSTASPWLLHPRSGIPWATPKRAARRVGTCIDLPGFAWAYTQANMQPPMNPFEDLLFFTEVFWELAAVSQRECMFYRSPFPSNPAWFPGTSGRTRNMETARTGGMLRILPHDPVHIKKKKQKKNIFSRLEETRGRALSYQSTGLLKK